ncbi:hypothetical protein R1N_05360 [Enterobacter asburiae]|nr:hypothetical protein EAA2563_05240 [Enterobacter asburiae]BCP68349.1 hypothetical protein R1N_05360 [Enterobacter asburiae]
MGKFITYLAKRCMGGFELRERGLALSFRCGRPWNNVTGQRGIPVDSIAMLADLRDG